MPLIETLPEDLETIHIIGIAGTAMGALAGMLIDAGYTVTGSDRAVYPPMSDYLDQLGIRVMNGFEAENLAHSPDLVVVGNVVRSVYGEAQALLASDLPYCSFPQLLGEMFLKDTHNVVIAGTHGKTTTTSVTAWLLDACGREPGFLIGGIAKNFDRTARAARGDSFVIEGDEYDTAFFDKRPKFVHYRPKTCILTSVEFDHADIYRDLAHVKESFDTLVRLLPEDGLLIVRGDDPGASEMAERAECTRWTYGPGQMWDGRIEGTDTDTGTMTFTLLRRGEDLGRFTTPLVGTHNLYNQVAALAASIHRGLSVGELQQVLPRFAGIRRRQEVIGEPGQVTVVDDFAHHPTAVKKTLEALRQRFGSRRLWAIWEPRSATSRRRVFQDAYAVAFDDADQVIVAAPYDTSRIPEEDRFSSTRLVQALNDRGLEAITLPDTATIAQTIATRAHPSDIIAILSNGGFGGLHQLVLDLLGDRFPPAS